MKNSEVKLSEKIAEKPELIEKLVEVKRVSKVVKGGRRFSFSALVVVGDGKGRAGFALGKANEVVEAVRKATDLAKKNMKAYSLYKNTIPHEVLGKDCSSRLLIKPGRPGSGIISCSPVRAIVEALGIKDINIKSMRSTNTHNSVRAFFDGISKIKSFEEIARRRGKSVEDIERIKL